MKLSTPYTPPETISPLITQARRTLTPLEDRFYREAHGRWPLISWRRYAPVTIRFHPEMASTWYAPFLCVKHKLIVIVEDRPDFPYAISGRNRDLYAQQGYTILDFSEDFSCPTDESVWQGMMQIVDAHLRPAKAA